jgi:histone H3/H4
MNAQQITALSRIQAQAIVSARPQTALLASGTPTVGKDGSPIQPTEAQIQHQIQLQAQALVHAHTQAQIQAGIYKGDNGTASTGAKPAQAGPITTKAAAATVAKSTAGITQVKSTAISTQPNPIGTTTTTSSTTNPIMASPTPSLSPAQLAQQNKLASRQSTTKEIMLKRHADEINAARQQFSQQNLEMTPSHELQASQQAQLKTITDRHASEIAQLNKSFQKDLNELHAEFRKQNAGGNAGTTAAASVSGTPSSMAMPSLSGVAMVPQNGLMNVMEDTTVVSSATSHVFLEKLSGTLSRFWTDQLHQMRELGNNTTQTEHDFKNHNDLPLARIKRIMKSDEDVRMISAEAPVLFAKACEMFILELTLRSWSYSENNKRRTLQKEDIREAIQRTDIFDFLVDVIH